MTKILTLALAASALVLASCASTKKTEDCSAGSCCKADAKATKTVTPAHKHAKK